MSQKTKKAKPLTLEMTAFDHGCLIEFIDATSEDVNVDRAQSNGKQRKKISPPKSAKKKLPTATDHERWRLRELEIFLNNCLNLARGIETKQMTKIIQLLRDARTQTQQLRG